MTDASTSPVAGASDNLKQCCARLYESDFVVQLLGESFHPGGLDLTKRVGVLLELGPDSRVLDAACGNGTTACFLASHFGCRVVGVDYGQQNISRARATATERGLSALVQFERADAEHLPFAPGTFDAVICECAFCTFPDKAAAAREFARVLRPGGQVGLSDVTRTSEPDAALSDLIAWVACVADARPADDYLRLLAEAGFGATTSEVHDDALRALVRQVQGRLLAAEVMAGLGKLDLEGVDLAAAKRMANAAFAAIRERRLGYAVMTATRAERG